TASLNETSWFNFLGSWSGSIFQPSYPPSQLSFILNHKAELDPNTNYIRDERIRDLNALIVIMRPEINLPIDWNILVNIGTKSVFTQSYGTQMNKINQEDRELFWHMFNIFQSPDINNTLTQDSDMEDINEEELWQLYEGYLHPLIQNAIKKGIITAENVDYL